MGNIFFTSDSHFSHRNVIKYSNRPFNDENHMNEVLISNWNRTVTPHDTVYHLGDFAFCKIDRIIQIINKLNGSLHIVLGNHDQEIIKNKKMLFDSCKNLKSISNAIDLRHNGHHLYLHHYGCRVWNKSHFGSIHLYGHSHNSLPPHGKSVDVGVDSTWITGKAEYRPFSLQEILTFMSTREISEDDHHVAKD